jgi:UDP-N-acetyl-D-mannosaminuronic acid dehydrogenase
VTPLAIDKVCIVGLGYIGLPTAAVIASRGVRVLGVDVKLEVVETINRGDVHIAEPDLKAITADAVADGFLRAATEPEPADVFILAVPTPLRNGKADVTYVEAAARSIAQYLSPGNIVIVESTCPPGTTELVTQILAELRSDLCLPAGRDEPCDVFVAYCPERVLPGRVLTELVENNRVIGGISDECSRRAVQFYTIFCKGALMTTDARTAEMCKLTENSFRDVNIAFANELSIVCDQLDINVWELIRLANGHPRVNILQPGPGVGGHCIAVDPWFIVEAAPREARIIRVAREINDGKPAWVMEKVRAALAGRVGPVRVACLGLAFKADVDDLRESPALHIAEELATWVDCELRVCEPFIKELPRSLAGRPNVTMVANGERAVDGADVVLLLVNHSQFGRIPREALAGKTVVDTRGVWSQRRSDTAANFRSKNSAPTQARSSPVSEDVLLLEPHA